MEGTLEREREESESEMKDLRANHEQMIRQIQS